MTPGNGHLRRHRRRMIALLIAALALLGWLVWGMVVDLRSRPVAYTVQQIQPVNAQLCPGDALRYEVSLAVTQVPVILEITESWCRVGLSGICSRALTTTYSVPILEPRAVYTMANRIIPESDFFQANDMIEFWHATTDGERVTGYVVGPVTIRDNCKKPGGETVGD